MASERDISTQEADMPLATALPSGFGSDEKIDYKDEKETESVHVDSVDGESILPENMLANGKERPIENANDMATRCVSLEDDPTMIVHTLRMWVIGIGLTSFAAVLGQIFYFRPQTVYVSGLFLQIIAYILGTLWSKLPGPKHGKFWAFVNPCPFTLKEHVAILIMTTTASSSALAISVFAAEDLYYNISPNYGTAIFTLLGSQLFGYGLAGLSRSFCVFPTYIVFPVLLPTVNLFDALHREKAVLSQTKRIRFFWIVFISIFVWEWFPEFIAPTLTGLSIFCLAKRDSPWVTRIFGGSNGNEGLGVLAISTDWNYVGSGGGSLGALFTPFYTQVSQYAGVAICIVLFSACYANNVWNAQNFPFLSQALFYENGTIYDQTLILDANNQLNQTALDIVGVPWFATTNALFYLGSNLAIGASLTHVVLWFMPSIIQAWNQYKTREQPDPHYQMMKAYPEVPMLWYGAIMVVSFAMSMATAYTGNSHLPWWALIVSLLLASMVYPFVLVVYATTGFNVDVQQLAQMLGAALVPGNPQANLYFTLYGSNTVNQARGLAQDLKLGQYTKLPPRDTFLVQTVGTVIGAVLQLVIMKSIIAAQRDILLSVQGTNIWSGQQVQSYNSLAITWGALAKEFYAPSSVYGIIPLSIIIGLFVPVPFWVIHRFYPRMKADKVVTPIMCWTLGYLSVGINSSVFTTMMIAVFSQFYLRRYRATWFRKYNYLLSAGLDAGTQIMVFVATFALFGGSGNPVAMPNWALNPDPASGVNLDYCMNLNMQ